MTSYEYTQGDEFRNIEHALWLLTAFRAEFDTPLKDNQWLLDEVKKTRPDRRPRLPT